MAELSKGITFLTAKEVAARLKKSESWIWDKTNKKSKNYDSKSAPRHEIYGGTRFVESEVDEWFGILTNGWVNNQPDETSKVVDGSRKSECDAIELRGKSTSPLEELSKRLVMVQDRPASAKQHADSPKVPSDNPDEQKYVVPGPPETKIAETSPAALTKDRIDQGNSEQSHYLTTGVVIAEDAEHSQSHGTDSGGPKIADTAPANPPSPSAPPVTATSADDSDQSRPPADNPAIAPDAAHSVVRVDDESDYRYTLIFPAAKAYAVDDILNFISEVDYQCAHPTYTETIPFRSLSGKWGSENDEMSHVPGENSTYESNASQVSSRDLSICKNPNENVVQARSDLQPAQELYKKQYMNNHKTYLIDRLFKAVVEGKFELWDWTGAKVVDPPINNPNSSGKVVGGTGEPMMSEETLMRILDQHSPLPDEASPASINRGEDVGEFSVNRRKTGLVSKVVAKFRSFMGRIPQVAESRVEGQSPAPSSKIFRTDHRPVYQTAFWWATMATILKPDLDKFCCDERIRVVFEDE